MALGGGRYDAETTALLAAFRASCVVLLVRGGPRGDGFSVSARGVHVLASLPSVLREMADQIENDLRKLQS